MSEYPNLKRIVYGEDRATFVPVCLKCGRFVKADLSIKGNGIGEWDGQPNATCAHCGRVVMLFEGYV